MSHPRTGLGFAAVADHHRRAFTLVELLVVVVIILILAGMLFPVFQQARARSKMAVCTNQLTQFGKALLMYREDSEKAMPSWLSNLNPNYVTAPELYRCPQDPSGGYDGNRPGAGFPSNTFNSSPITAYGQISPDGLRDQYDVLNPSCKDEYFYVDDTARNDDRRVNGNKNVKYCSYLYEWADTECLWISGTSALSGKTWGQVKEVQLASGMGRQPVFETTGAPWELDTFPTVRCVYHWSVLWGKNQLVLNTAYAGTFFLSQLKWESGVY